jgi:YD repeat-containing protein
MPRFFLAAFLFLVPNLAAQPVGPERDVDPAVPHHNAAEVAPGIRLANGSLAYAQTDLTTAGRVMGLSLRRVWRADMDFDGPLGRGWICEYLQAAWRDTTTTDIYWHDPDGFMHSFIEYDGAYLAPPGVYVRATWDDVAETVSLRRADGTVLNFNAGGQLAAIADRNGNGITLQYDGSDQLESVTDDRGESWEFLYDDGRISQLIDHVWETGSRDARIVEFAYTDGNLTRVSLPETSRFNDADSNRIAWEYSYDASDRLTEVFAPNEVLSAGTACRAFEYDTNSRVISFRDEDAVGAHLLRYTVNASSEPLVRHIDPRGARVDYTLDAAGHATKVEEYTRFWAVDETTPIDHAYVAEASGKVRASDPDKFTTVRDFNAGHRLTGIGHPAGNVAEFIYPDPGLLGRGTATDVTGSVIEVADAGWSPGDFVGGYARLGSSAAEFAFHEIAGNTADAITVTGADLEALGWGAGATIYVFTQNPDPLAAGNLLEHRRISADSLQANIVRSWTYEPYFQQVRSEISARGFTTTWKFEFDGSGDPADGNVTRKLWPEVTILLPDGTTDTVIYETSYTYNSYGQLAETIDPEGSVEVRHYYSTGDQVGFLQEIIRAEGVLDLTERFEYDKTGVLTGQCPPAAFEPGAGEEDFKTIWQVNELGQRWHEAGRVVAGGERVQVYRYFDPSGNEIRRFTSYVTVDGDAPPSPTDTDDPNSFTKDSAEMVATWLEVTHGFDLGGRIVEETSDAIADNPVETVTWANEYDALGNRTARVSPLQNRTEYDYDERGLLWRRIEGAGCDVEGVYEHDYDLNGLIAAHRTPLDNETVHSHDGHGREIAIIDPEGNARAFELDASGNVIGEICTDANELILAEISWLFDEIERCNRQQRLAETAFGAPIGDGVDDTRLTLDGRGAVLQRNDGAGRTWTFEYDAAGRLVTQTDPVGNEVSLTLNAAGDPTLAEYSDWNRQTEDFEASRWEADYNTLGVPVTVRDRRYGSSFDTSVGFAWDGWRRLTTKTDADGVEVAFTYDLRSRKTSERENPTDVLLTEGSGHDWDRDDRLIGRDVFDDPNQATEFEYDERNRLTSITRPDETSVVQTWDADSRLAGREDENGTVVAQTFDGRGLVLSRTITGLAHGADTETFEYDGAGRVTSAESLRDEQLLACTEWSWNTLHRAESHTLTLGDLDNGEIGSWTTTAEYDQRGHLVSHGFSDSGGIDYTLDALSRITAVVDTSTTGTLAECLWAGPDRPVLTSLGNGIEAGFQYETGFAGVARIQHTRGSEVLWGVDRMYDLRGLPIRERRDHDGATGRATRFDALRRLTATHLGADLAGTLFDDAPIDFGMLREFNLDTHGSRSGLDGLLDSDIGEDPVYATAYVVSSDGMNRYESADGAMFEYDDGGAVDGDVAAGLTYAWDYRDQVAIVDDTAVHTSPLRVLRYDAQGRRVYEEEYEGSTLVRRTVLLYGAGDRLLEEIHLDACDDEIARLKYAHGPHGILAEDVGAGWRYHHHDQDGSLIGLTDEDGKRIVEFDYLPLGAPVRRAVMLDVAPSEISDVDEDTPLSTGTRIHVSATLTSGALTGRELAIAVPAAASNRYRITTVLANGTDTIDVHDPAGLIADALLNEGSGFLVYEARLSMTTPGWTYDSPSDTSTFEVTGADFSPWLLGGHLTPDVTRPTFLEIIEVDEDGDWLKVRGDAGGTSGSDDHYRALPPVGVDADGNYTTDIGGRYLYRGYRHDPATRLASWPDTSWANRSGTYVDGGRTFDPRTGRWFTPAYTWRNSYEYAPDGTLDVITPPTGAPGLRERWSPSPACPTQSRGQPGFRFAEPVMPGSSG